MNEYQVTLEAEICVTVHANSEEEAEAWATLNWQRPDVEILGAYEIECLDEEDDDNEEEEELD
jgi:hypothetical protein